MKVVRASVIQCPYSGLFVLACDAKVRAFLCLVARGSFISDFLSDALVTKQLLPDHPIWATLSAIAMLMTYVYLLVTMGRSNFAELINAVVSDVLKPIFGEETIRTSLHFKHGSFRARLLYLLLGIPILFFVDIYLNFRYICQEPYDAKLFSYMKLRGLSELLEAITQLLLQMYIFIRQTNACGYFPFLEVHMVQPIMLMVSISFSLKSVKD